MMVHKVSITCDIMYSFNYIIIKLGHHSAAACERDGCGFDTHLGEFIVLRAVAAQKHKYATVNATDLDSIPTQENQIFNIFNSSLW